MTNDPSLVAPGQPSWAALAATVRGCTACPELVLSRTTVVAGVLPPAAGAGDAAPAAGDPARAAGDPARAAGEATRAAGDAARAAGEAAGAAGEAAGAADGGGPARVDVLLVGEAPGAQEDLAGVPFVGKSGQLLDSLLAEAGLPRDRVGVANVLKCRPPANRKPRRAEVARCRPWLERQIELAAPRVMVALGGTATEWFFGSGARISALRPGVHDAGGRSLVVTYHPSAAIRFGPKGAPLAALREDLRAVAGLVAGSGGVGG